MHQHDLIRIIFKVEIVIILYDFILMNITST